jgi:hypothetical protein
MATFFKFEQFVEDLAHKVHDLSADTLKVYLTNVAPSASLDAVKADLAEISTGSGYTGALTCALSASGQASGTYKLTLTDPALITASGGTIGPFQYAVLFNDTPTSPADPLIGAWDYGSAITLQIGESFQVDLSAGNGVLQLT